MSTYYSGIINRDNIPVRIDEDNPYLPIYVILNFWF